MLNFPISSQDCELLLLFGEHKSLEKIANLLDRDASVISRQLKSLALRTQTIEKVEGRWQVSKIGERIILWSKNAIEDQKSSLKGKMNIRIATTREFAARILIPDIRKLVGDKDLTISILSSDEGVENLLLTGKADLGFDCGRPNDPGIAFKKIIKESFVCVATPKFILKNKISSYQNLNMDYCLKFVRTEVSLLEQESQKGSYFGTFSDIATQRQAALMGYGWAIIPYYAVALEIARKELVVISGFKVEEENYGVWWERSQSKVPVLDLINSAKNWLKSLESQFILNN